MTPTSQADSPSSFHLPIPTFESSSDPYRDSFAEMLQSVVANGHSFQECQEILRQSQSGPRFNPGTKSN